MSSSLLTPIETARRYISVGSVAVGDLYTAHALGTQAAGFIKRYPQDTHTVSLPCNNGGSVAHITVRPESNGVGHYSYARVVEVKVEPAELPELDEPSAFEFSAGM